MELEKTCCVTGHREIPAGRADGIRELLRREVLAAVENRAAAPDVHRAKKTATQIVSRPYWRHIPGVHRPFPGGSFFLRLFVQLDFAVFLLVVGDEFPHQLEDLAVGGPSRIAADVPEFGEQLPVHPQAEMFFLMPIQNSLASNKSNMTLF